MGEAKVRFGTTRHCGEGQGSTLIVLSLITVRSDSTSTGRRNHV